MGTVSCEQIVRDILAEMPDEIRERLEEGESPQTFTAGDVSEMAEVLRDHIGFLRANVTRKEEALAEAQRQCRALHAQLQLATEALGRDDWERLLVRIATTIEAMTPEEREAEFKAMGGREIVTPYGTLRLIPGPLMKEQ